MKRLTDLISYIRNKLYVKSFELNPRNYMGKPKTRLVTSKYCSAVADIVIYETS